MSKKASQSFIAASLTSTFGVFISKLIGLLYIVPFTALAGGETNMIFYSVAYTYYDLLLQICTAGLPFAIAALVSKYATKNDFKTVDLIKKLSKSILLLSGFIMALVFIILAFPLSKSVLGRDASIEDIRIMRNVFFILSIAIVLVPYLSYLRGFYQGLKELKVYAFSQVLEQISRVFFLLILGYIFVKIIKFDSIYAIYMAVLSTSIAALIAIIYYHYFDKKNYKVIKIFAKQQDSDVASKHDILVELLSYGLPFVVVSILGNSMNIVNNNFFMNAMAKSGLDYQLSKTILGIIQVNTAKLIAIPQVLSIGFGSGIVPHLTEALVKKDYGLLRKDILSGIETVLYIGLPVSFCLFGLSREIYYVMYGAANLELGSELLKYSSGLAIVSTLSPICSNMMMTLKFRKKTIEILLISFVTKIVSFFIFIRIFSYSGAITSSILTSIVIVVLDLLYIGKKFKVDYSKTLLRVFKMFLCLLSMNGIFVILRMVGFSLTYDSRLLGLAQLAVYGILGMIVYYLSSAFLGLPKNILGFSLKKVFKSGKIR